MATISSPPSIPTTLDSRDQVAGRDSGRPAGSAEQTGTAPLRPNHPIRRDTVSLLDHRSRRRVLPRRIAPPGHYLGLTDADGESVLIPLEDRIVHIGRASTADLRFEDVHVSRRHAIIVRYGNHVRVLDDRSSAGTFVNGSRVVACDLRAGDVVRLGPVSFVYEVVS